MTSLFVDDNDDRQRYYILPNLLMLSRTTANQVAESFISHYYRIFVEVGHLSGLRTLYGDSSRIMVTGNPSLDAIVLGTDIAFFLSELDEKLQRRKVDISAVDAVPLPDGSIQLVCHCTLYLHLCKWSYIHIFVVSPTPHRPTTYFIRSEHFCFHANSVEQPPEGVTILLPFQVATFLAEDTKRRHEALERQQAARQQQQLERRGTSTPQSNARKSSQQQPQKAVESEKAPQKNRERPARDVKPAVHKEEKVEVAAKPEAAAGERAEGTSGRSRRRRDRKAKAEKAAAAALLEAENGAPQAAKPAAAEKPKAETKGRKEGGGASRSGPTNSVRLANIPPSVSLNAVKDALKKLGEVPQDVSRFGRDSINIVAKYSSEAAAEKVYKTATIELSGESYKIHAFYP